MRSERIRTRARRGAMRGVWAMVLLGVASPVVAQATTLEPPASTHATSAAPIPAIETHWYIVEIGGQRAGWMRSVQTTTADEISTLSESSMRIGRGETALEISTETSFVETPEGTPKSIVSKQTMSKTPVENEWIFGKDGITQTTTQDKKVTVKTLPNFQEAWLPLAASERYVKAQIAKGEKTVSFNTIDPSLGLRLMKVTQTDEGRETLTVLGEAMDLHKASVTMEQLPGVVTTVHTNDDGDMIKTTTHMGPISIEMTLSTQAEATRDFAPPELMVRTFVTPDRAINGPRTVAKARYRLSIDEGEMPDIPATGSQSVRRENDKASVIIVDTSFPNAITPDEAKNPAWLATSAMTDLTDEKLKDLHERAVKNAKDSSRERAEAMRRFVHEYIRRKSLGVGFATASEIARDREGDCSEHAVLLATLLRLDGIPARAACGLIYADAFAGAKSIFGYHMWTQALLEVDGTKRWVDLDATLPGNTPYDATHITLGVSSLNDTDVTESLVNLVPLLGRVKIAVESTEP
ncbi:MAG: transglutaminase family protein [Phycisphaerales bacterium]